MSDSKNTLQRQWLMLLKIPHYPHSMTTKELADYLNTKGYTINIRSIQRNLNELSSIFQLSSEKREQKTVWFWIKDAKFTIPSMTATLIFIN